MSILEPLLADQGSTELPAKRAKASAARFKRPPIATLVRYEYPAFCGSLWYKVRLQNHETCDRVATLECHVVLGLAREGLLWGQADWSGVMGGKDNSYGKIENK